MSVVGIVGDREVLEADTKLIEDAIKASGFTVTKVVSGGARGADTLAANWAKANKVKLKEYPANWKDLTVEGCKVKEGAYGKYNAMAGFQRNQLIVDAADCIIALQPNGKSDGTSDTIEKAKKKGISVFIYPPEIASAYSYTF